MKRKIIKQRDSYTVTLPIKWVKEFGIDETKEIDIQESPEGMMIRPEGIPFSKRETTLWITSEREPFVRVSLNNLYRLGYDRIKIFHETKKQKDIALDVTENFLLGFELTEEKEKFFIIENVTEPDESKQVVLLRRVFLLIKQAQEQIHDDLEQGRYSNLKKIKQLTQKVGQYNNFCRRNVSKKRFTNERISFHWSVYTYLSLIQHSILHLYESLAATKKLRITEKNLNLFAQLRQGFDVIYKAYFNMDLKKIRKGNTMMKDLLAEILSMLKKSRSAETEILYYFGELARLTYLMTSPMLGILL